MSSPYVGEVRLVGFNFAPVNWSICNGNILSISGNESLFNLIGTTYGGNGQTTFGLPNLQGRVPVHQGTGGGATYVIGQLGGQEAVSISAANYPAHNHTLQASSTAGASATPANNTVGSGSKIYAPPTDNPGTAMNAAMVSVSTGGNLPHNNVQPFLALNWIIALYGIFPPHG